MNGLTEGQQQKQCIVNKIIYQVKYIHTHTSSTAKGGPGQACVSPIPSRIVINKYIATVPKS